LDSPVRVVGAADSFDGGFRWKNKDFEPSMVLDVIPAWGSEFLAFLLGCLSWGFTLFFSVSEKEGQGPS
jgi:hypothetical protein